MHIIYFSFIFNYLTKMYFSSLFCVKNHLPPLSLSLIHYSFGVKYCKNDSCFVMVFIVKSYVTYFGVCAIVLISEGAICTQGNGCRPRFRQDLQTYPAFHVDLFIKYVVFMSFIVKFCHVCHITLIYGPCVVTV